MRSVTTVRLTLALTLAACLLAGCGLIFPADSVLWDVKVHSATFTEEWDTFYVDADSDNYIVVLEIEYRNLRKQSAQFSPESVVLVHTGSEETGWGQTPALHRAGGSTLITDFDEESVMYEIAAGESRVDSFVYEFPRGFTDFTLYFPESPAIALTLK